MKSAVGWSVLYLLLSFASFPGLDCGWLAWFSMVPLLLALRDVKRLRPFVLAVFGIEWLRWVMLIVWLRHVSWFAVIGIAGAFALVHVFWFLLLRWNTGSQGLRGVSRLAWVQVIGLAAAWACFEWLRTQRYGLPGAHFSITQWKDPMVLQVVSVVGGYGLSAALVAVNLWITQAVLRWLDPSVNRWKAFWVPLTGISVVLAIILGFGAHRLGNGLERKLVENGDRSIRFGLVQPDLPPYLSWNRERMQESVWNVWSQSSQLMADDEVKVIFWPEGTLPGPMGMDGPMQREVESWVDQSFRVPVVFGNQVIDRNGKAFNAVQQVVPDQGWVPPFYAKRILVPFGEFIPLRSWFPGIETVVPIPADFQAGRSQVSIRVESGGSELNISPLICYEDCFPALLLGDNLSEVDLIFVATYNGWYGEEFGAYFHAAHSVLRAVEVGRPVIRCGSAGWSGWIDRWGRIRYVLTNPDGSIYFRGFGSFAWEPDIRETTFYQRYHRRVHLAIALLALTSLYRGRSTTGFADIQDGFVRKSGAMDKALKGGALRGSGDGAVPDKP